MGLEDDPGREKRRNDQEALDELRRLHTRNRETARLGRMTEHDEPSEPRPENPDKAPAPPGR
jgi:hypothetical protein